MDCIACGTPASRVVKSMDDSVTVLRFRQCQCGARWRTNEVPDRKTLRVISGHRPPLETRTAPILTTKSQDQALALSSSGSGSDQALPPDPLSNPDLSRSDRERARSESGAKGPFVAMRDEFVAQWERAYGAKYLFAARDGVQLATMIKRQPETASIWPAMVERYLASEFWAQKRHPLSVLVTRPGEFAGDVRQMPRAKPAGKNGAGPRSDPRVGHFMAENELGPSGPVKGF